jgi:predicted component of type VI protein secretion system
VASLTLEIVEGPGAGQQATLTDPLVIGRAADVDLVLDDRQVSRHHARVRPDNGEALVEDLGSSNGTFVNGQELHAPARVTPGDEIMVGVTLLELRSQRDVEARPSVTRPVPPPLAAPARQPSYVEPLPPAPPATPALDRLRDIHVKTQARTAPLAIFVVVTLAVLIYLATR